MIFKDIQAKDGDITYLCEYVPRNRPRCHDKRSEDLVLAYKNKEKSAIQYVCDQIVPQLGDDFSLAAIPSSKMISNGCAASHELIRMIIAKAGNKKLIDAGCCLIRTKDIPAQHETKGKRNSDVLRDSLGVQSPELIRGRDVLVIDDITTSGNSFSTAREALLCEGAASVVGFAVGKTITNNELRNGFIFDIDDKLSGGKSDEVLERLIDEIFKESVQATVSLITRHSNEIGGIPGIDFVLERDESGAIPPSMYDGKITSLYAHAKQLMRIYEPCITMFGKSEQDIRLAKALGMVTVLIADQAEKSEADFAFDSVGNAISSLPQILEKANAAIDVLQRWRDRGVGD